MHQYSYLETNSRGVAMTTCCQLHILQHSLGLNEYGQGEQYRNHFATSSGSDDFDHCQALAAQGLMKDLGARKIFGGMHCFAVTDAGVRFVAENSPQPPKLSKSKRRYQKYLDCGDCFDNFRHFLDSDMARNC